MEVWPGPMEGVGSNEFVRAASELGLTGVWMTPFIRITQSVPSLKKMVSGISAYLDSGLPVVVQLMGDDPVLLGQSGRRLLELPGVSGINLNMGCPSSRVVRHGSGGGLLKDPRRAADLALAVADMLPEGKFSVKVRSGFADSGDMEIFLPVLADGGKVAAIFFHYRTVREGYLASALPFREERIARAVALCGKVPLIANGDIDSVECAENLIRQTGAAGVMIARPWMKDPFLLRRFSGIAPDAEEGRERFFAELRANGVANGALIGMAKMLWGSESLRFREILSGGGGRL